MAGAISTASGWPAGRRAGRPKLLLCGPDWPRSWLNSTGQPQERIGRRYFSLHGGAGGGAPAKALQRLQKPARAAATETVSRLKATPTKPSYSHSNIHSPQTFSPKPYCPAANRSHKKTGASAALPSRNSGFITSQCR